MKTHRHDHPSLWHTLCADGNLRRRFLGGSVTNATLSDLVRGSCIAALGEELRDRSVLISTRDQFTAALALIELDGIARRLVLCPSDLAPTYLPVIMDSADVDSIVTDRCTVGAGFPAIRTLQCSSKIVPASYDRTHPCQTEWILLTSGTTGPPKLVVQNLTSLVGAIEHGGASTEPFVWSTFYDIRRYGGLQIFLRFVLTGASLVLSDAKESTADFLTRAGCEGVTHISGTPSHWRRALMSPAAHKISPQYIRLSGEIADQAILNNLQSFYPQSRIAHAFASTEAGVAFAVDDGLAGFPTDFVGHTPDVDLKVEDGSLRIRSARSAIRYLGSECSALRDADGFIDTGDMVEERGDRYYFVGRRDGVINVGGLKVHPEEVEAVVNRHPQVRMSLVRTRKNPITGALVVADVVLKADGCNEIKREIVQMCRAALSPHKVPSSITFVPALPVSETGKLMRYDA
jgi:acyl-coenzyme A synthetase/AMP-(fatty) acid ligase